MSLCDMCQTELADEVRIIRDTPHCLKCWENLKCGNCGTILEDDEKKESFNGWCRSCIENEHYAQTYGDCL